MNNMGTKTPTTVEQFAQVHTADTEDYELVEGELIPLSNGTPKHAKIRRRVEGLVENYFETNPIGELLGEVDCRISDDTVRRPDVSIFMGGRIQAIDMEAIPVPFALAVEVLSPSESAVNVRRKVREYLRVGSSEVWLVDHSSGEVLVHATAGIRVLQGDDNLESPLLPGFRADVAGLVK